MYRKVLLSTFLVSIFFLLVSCERKRVTPTPEAGIANPASVYCEEHGGKLEIRTASDGGQVGICIFPDGSECDEWAYFRGECAPAGATTTGTPPSTP
jgi:inhibitor of cysteine peptidase